MNDDNELVVIDHPGTMAQRGDVIAHPNTDRKVHCKPGATEVTVPPTTACKETHVYARTGEHNVDGLPIFRKAIA